MNFFDKPAEIIREAAKSMLGLAALVILCLAFLALAFFREAAEEIRFATFGMIFVGAGLFLTSIIRLESSQRPNTKDKVMSHHDEVRNQVAAICYRRTTSSIEFLLVKTDGGRWIFPKGNIDPGEQPWKAAQREAFEEAGVVGDIKPEVLTTFLHGKRGKKQRITELTVDAFSLLVKDTQPPREPGRNPTWFAAEQAIAALREDRDFKYAAELERVVRSACASLI